MSYIINNESVKRAKVILEKVAYVTARIKERDEARQRLQTHIKALEKEVSQNKIDQLKILIDNLFNKEANLLRNNFYESEEIKKLKRILIKLTREHTKAMNALSYMKKHNKDYIKLKQLQNKREKFLEKKINQSLDKNKKLKLRARLMELETKFKEYKYSGKVPNSMLSSMKNRIENIKKSLV